MIVDELFVGNKLAAGEIRTSDGTAIDLRNIRSPIVVFCSKGDNITPPQQALDWILDLYDSVDEIRACGQTIVYTVHEHGRPSRHLRLRRRREEGARRVRQQHRPDRRAAARPLRGGARRRRARRSTNPDLVTGEWVMRCEARTLDDIRALGGNDLADERRFATAARVSEINLALYRTFAQPCGARHGRRRRSPRRCGGCIRCGCSTRCSRHAQPVHGAGRRRSPSTSGRTGTPSRGRQPVPRHAGEGVAADRRRARGLARHRERLSPRRPSTRSTARRRCRRRSASTPTSDAAAAQGAPRACSTGSWSSGESRSSGPHIPAGRPARGDSSARCSTSAWRAPRSTSAASRRSRRIREAHGRR